MLRSSNGQLSSSSALTTEKQGRPDSSATGSNANDPSCHGDALEEPGEDVEHVDISWLPQTSCHDSGHNVHGFTPLPLEQTFRRCTGVTGSTAARRDAAMGWTITTEAKEPSHRQQQRRTPEEEATPKTWMRCFAAARRSARAKMLLIQPIHGIQRALSAGQHIVSGVACVHMWQAHGDTIILHN